MKAVSVAAAGSVGGRSLSGYGLVRSAVASPRAARRGDGVDDTVENALDDELEIKVEDEEDEEDEAAASLVGVGARGGRADN